MDFDFEKIFVLLTVVTGGIWGLYAIVFKNKKNAAGEQPLVVDYAKSFFPVFLIVVVIRSFLIEPYRIPTGSMMPSLLVGDFIMVNKFSYGIKLPITRTEIIPVGKPKHGDVMVFRYPKNPKINYIKRVIGIPGDKVEYKNKVLYINGVEMEQTKLGTYVGDNGRNVGSEHFKERLLDIEHDILHRNVPAQDWKTEIPAGQYLMIGDNRDNSNDSRYWGFVPEENVVGKAFLVWMSLDFTHWDFKPQRIGNLID